MKCSEGICFAPVIIWNVSTWTVAAAATRAWLVGIAAHPATQATMKRAALTANNVLPHLHSPSSRDVCTWSSSQRRSLRMTRVTGGRRKIHGTMALA